MANARINLSDTLWRKVKSTAALQNTTASEVVSSAITSYFSVESGSPAFTANLSMNTFDVTDQANATISKTVSVPSIAQTGTPTPLGSIRQYKPVPKPESRKRKLANKTTEVKPEETW